MRQTPESRRAYWSPHGELYRCKLCGEVFDTPAEYTERHRFGSGCYEEQWAVCPVCGGNFDEYYGEEEEDEDEVY